MRETNKRPPRGRRSTMEYVKYVGESLELLIILKRTWSVN